MIEVVPGSSSTPNAVCDPERLLALDSYKILDSLPEESFDTIAQLAALSCATPVALVSLVAGDRQWFKAKVGFPPCQTDLNSSVCAYALTEPDLLIIPDLRVDPRTRDNPLVTGQAGICFYAGAPLRDRAGHVLGSLCVIDKVPRPHGLTEQQAAMLRILAGQVMALLDLRRAVTGRDKIIAHRRRKELRRDEVHARLQISEAHWRGLFERMNEGLIIGELMRDAGGQVVDWCYLSTNSAWGDLVGVDPANAIGRTIREVFPGIEDAWIQDFAQVVDTGEAITFSRSVGSLNRWYEGRVFPLEGDQFAVLFTEITDRVRADQCRNALIEIGDQLRSTSAIEDVTRTVATIVGKVLGVTRAGFGLLDAAGEYVTIEPDWTAPGTSSIAGRHCFEDWGDIRKELLLDEPLVIEDAQTDPRTAADPERWAASSIGALVNIPIQERGRTVAVFLVHNDKPRPWDTETVAFLRNVADRLMAAVGRINAENQQDLLNKELSHRMKNMLAMIQAIAGQTLKGVAQQEAVKSFQQRLLALSSAHNVLLQKTWTTAPLHEVIEAALEPLGVVDRFTITGPAVMLGSRAAMSLSLLIHELATNASKYGSLSVEAGRVVLRWESDTAADELLLTWEELGGPPAMKPSRKGFGSRLIQLGLVGTGGVELRYLPVGFQAEMRARLDQVHI